MPNQLASNTDQVSQVPASLVPTTGELVEMHQRQGRSLTEQHVFGQDPLEDTHIVIQQLRERHFYRRYSYIQPALYIP